MSFISYLVNGLSLGSVYALIALGYTMVYGIAKMLNFAHGDVIMIGAYVALVSMNQAGMPVPAAVVISIVACTVLGVVMERIAYKPLRNASSSLAVLITAIGVSYLLQNVALLIFGANAKTFPSVIKWKGISVAGGELKISGETIVTIVVCVVIMVVLMAFVQKTKPGQAMRGCIRGQRCGTVNGNQCKRNDRPYICNRFRTGGSCRGSSLFHVSESHTVYRSNAGNQSVCCSSIWWNRIDPGSVYRRNPAGTDRNFQ